MNFFAHTVSFATKWSVTQGRVAVAEGNKKMDIVDEKSRYEVADFRQEVFRTLVQKEIGQVCVGFKKEMLDAFDERWNRTTDPGLPGPVCYHCRTSSQHLLQCL